MKLSELIATSDVLSFAGDKSVEVRGITFDSRNVEPGFLFVALRGAKTDGHSFVARAVKLGAAAVVVESEDMLRDVPGASAVVQVKDARRALAHIAAAWYRRPFDRMNLWGVTGTNGKTTTSYLLESVLSAAGRRTGLIGTVNWRVDGEAYPSSATTPEPLELMKILSFMAEKEASDVVMEVSSHALVQQRVAACSFKGAVFTNLSRDHLDYHRTMKDYLNAKAILFENLGRDATAVLNGDDPAGKVIAARTSASVLTYGTGDTCDVRAVETSLKGNGIQAHLKTPEGNMEIFSPLVGTFNVYNLLAAVAAGLCAGVRPDSVAAGIASLKGIPGRLEPVANSRSVTILVDYAHSPDALKKAIEAVRHMVPGRFITVFGCGGDRDPGKREEMGRIAAGMSDLVFITSDNPRTEDPAAIAAQIESGVRAEGMRPVTGSASDAERGYLTELDRGAAIRAAVEAARPGDLVLIAGKGHENYQETNGVRRPFDDRLAAARAAAEARS